MQTRLQKNLARSGEAYYQEIVKEFGEEILKDNSEIDRKRLSQIIFFDKAKKDKLDKITAKHVVPKIIEEAKNNKEDGTSVIDVPLLFESGLDRTCDITIGVIADKETCTTRIIERDGITEEEARKRIESQNTEQFFKINCNYCIFNNDEDFLNKQINEILNGRNLSNKEVIQVNDGKIKYLQFRRLLEYSDKLQHCYSLRPLDFGKNRDYDVSKEKIHKEYEIICKSLNLNADNVYRPKQMHTNVVKKVEEENPGVFTEDFENVDGLVTNKKDKILSLSFADCISLFFFDPIKNVIGDIHSGWRGTYKEIAKEAICLMKNEYNSNPKDLICCIGPSIKKCCFEVSKEVRDMFYEKFKWTGRIDEIIIPSNRPGKYYIDTVLINRIILESEGINSENIIESDICTKCNHDKIHSYRAEGESFGINTAIISLI